MSSQALMAVPQFSQEQVDIIKSQIAPKGTTNDELAMFLQYCQRTGLDPFARQIYLSERRSMVNGQWVVTRKPETTVDGFRATAERAGRYAGQLGPFWCGTDGQWHDVWIGQDVPFAAKVGVLRDDFKEPLWAVAHYDEYVQKKQDGNPNTMWAKMPANQLAKCAESLALRRAFPRQLSGLYTREEMPTEQHEAKEAQKAYLAEKGLEPYVAQPKQDVRTASEQHKALILETAKMLDEPSAIKTIEIRQSVKDKEAQAILDEAQRDQKAKMGRSGAHGCIPLDKLKNWKKLKDEIRSYTGTDEIYKSTLKAKGYDHANEIPTQIEAASIWSVLGHERNRLKQEKELLATLEHASEVIGVREFSNILGAHGAETMADALKLEGDPLGLLLTDLKAQVDQRKGQA